MPGVSAAALRKVATAYAAENKDEVMRAADPLQHTFSEAIMEHHRMTPAKYRKHMQTNATWGGRIEVCAVGKALGVEVECYCMVGENEVDKYQSTQIGNGAAVVRVLFNKSDHYYGALM